MLLISNYVKSYVKFPRNATVRINMAWIKDTGELSKALDENKNMKVFLDFPQNRSKFPKPVLNLNDACEACNNYPQIKYFAVSNVEEVENIKSIQMKIPTMVEFVPKIETFKGVMNLASLIYHCDINTIMLDKEDLLSDVKKDNDEFYRCVEHVRGVCKGLEVKVLELKGVVFIG